MSPYTFFAVPAAFWLASLAAVVLAFRWSIVPGPRRFWGALLLSGVTLAIGCLGLSRFHATASKTVNGSLQWRIDSNWFFEASLLLGAVSIGFTLWKWRKDRFTRASLPSPNTGTPLPLDAR